MKKYIFIFVLSFCISMLANAQLKVYSSGRVGVACNAVRIASVLSVGNGEPSYTAAIKGSEFNKCGLYVDAIGTNDDGISIGITGKNNCTSYIDRIGILGDAYVNTVTYFGSSIGVKGFAGCVSNGCNYGVYGTIAGNNGGAGVYGTIDPDSMESPGAKYAGYFVGNTKVKGNLTVTGSINGVILGSVPSNVNGATNDSFSERLNALEAVSFMANDTSDVVTERLHYGLLPERMKEAFPELVYEQADGTVGINYVELIPALVQTINELTERIQTLEGGEPKKARATNIYNVDAEETYLLQNTPNPANGTTTITYSIPANTSSAEICICDMSGQMKKSQNLTEKGKSSITVSTHDLSSGIYLYSLIVNGEVCATKRMIVKQ